MGNYLITIAVIIISITFIISNYNSSYGWSITWALLLGMSLSLFLVEWFK